jgi:hypothetical protein
MEMHCAYGNGEPYRALQSPSENFQAPKWEKYLCSELRHADLTFFASMITRPLWFGTFVVRGLADSGILFNEPKVYSKALLNGSPAQPSSENE